MQSLDFERHQRYSAIEAITTNERGYSALRDATRSATGAAIPFLGLSLTDLTFLEEGAPDLLEPPAINWLKCERRFSILTEIFERGARDLSNLDLDPATQDLHHLIELLDLSEMDACSRSLRIEPRRIDSGVPVSPTLSISCRHRMEHEHQTLALQWRQQRHLTRLFIA